MTEMKTRRPKGTGTVRPKGAGWAACWWITDPGTGKRAQRSKSGFATKPKAEAYLRKIMVAKDNGTHVDQDRKLTVGQLLDSWLVAKRVEGCRPTTLDSYAHTLKWIKPRIGGLKVAALTTEQVDAMLSDLLAHGARNGEALSPRSVQLAGTVVRMALRWAVRRGHVARNVAADAAVPGANSAKMRYWDGPSARKYVAAAQADREGALYVLGVLRGMRRGELCGLRWSAVDLDGGALRVAETLVLSDGKAITSKPKTEAGNRRVPLDPFLVGVLREQRKRQLVERMAAGSAWAGGDYVFTDELGRPLRPEHVSDKHAALAKAAEVEVIRFHDLRHTCATLLLAAGVPVRTVADMLGQSDPSVTLRVYGHVIPGHADAAGEALTASVMGL